MRLLIIIVIFFISCRSKYSAERYVINKAYRDLITSFKQGDTLKFKNGKGNSCLYFITSIDSSFVDEGKGLMNVKGRKDIVVSCHELTNPKQGYEDYHIIILNRYPSDEFASFGLRLKDFYGIDPKEPFILNTDTIVANELSFTNYYSFRPFNYLEQSDSNSITKIYMTNKQGIIAYKYLSGEWWTRTQ